MHEKALCLLFWLCSKGLMVYWIIINKTYRDFRFVGYTSCLPTPPLPTLTGGLLFACMTDRDSI